MTDQSSSTEQSEARAPSPNRPREPLRGPFGGRALYLFRVFNIDIGLDYSWIVIFLLVTISLITHFGGQYENWSAAMTWTTAIATSLLFFVSILLHELGHSVTSNKLGVPIRSITLFIFGGVARLSRDPDRPRDEFLIAVMGPAVSIFLSGFFFAAFALLPEKDGALAATRALCFWLGYINFILVAFNCIPGFPLDGGRMFRAAVWAMTGSFGKATRIAAAGGAAFAYGLIILGILIAFFVQGGFINGLWLIFIGWFLLSAAKSSVAQLVFRESLDDVTVREACSHELNRVSGSMSVQQLIDGPILHRGERTFFVDIADRSDGLVTLKEIKQVPPDERDRTPVQAIASPLDRLHCLGPDETLWTAMRRMDEAGVNQLPVVDGGELIGVLTRESVLRILRNHLEFDRD